MADLLELLVGAAISEDGTEALMLLTCILEVP
jgi:hypothetical protein